MFQSIDPATGASGATHPELTADELDARLARAAAAYRDWRRSHLSERQALLGRIADRFEAEAERLAEIATAEMGKTLTEARAEVAKCAAAFRYYAQEGPAMLADLQVTDGVRALRQPIGPVLAVMPWNFPYWQAVRFIAPALMAGNVALLKHASNVQGVASAMEALVLAAGAPEGVFQNLAIRSGAVERVIADERVAAVTLTGSEAAGAAVAEAAGRALKKVVLELGGSDPFVVMPSADLDAAAKAAVRARVQNAGQSCICAKRMIVHAEVYDAFLERFAAGMRAVKVGDPRDPASDIGPLSSEEARAGVLGQVAAMRAAGGRVLVGAEALPEPGAFLSPGVVVDLPPDAPVAREEVFGPVATVFRADDADAAVTLANDVPFGLGASVWTNDPAERERLVRGLDCGMVAVNAVLASTPEAPFGGIKRSGHGRELGAWGMHEFTNLKAVFG